LEDYSRINTARKDFLGVWIVQTEGAKFWFRVINELTTRTQGGTIFEIGKWFRSCGE
jgi:hypothetical protein